MGNKPILQLSLDMFESVVENGSSISIAPLGTPKTPITPSSKVGAIRQELLSKLWVFHSYSHVKCIPNSIYYCDKTISYNHSYIIDS